MLNSYKGTALSVTAPCRIIDVQLSLMGDTKETSCGLSQTMLALQGLKVAPKHHRKGPWLPALQRPPSSLPHQVVPATNTVKKDFLVVQCCGNP